jgi:hypothetical protein
MRQIADCGPTIKKHLIHRASGCHCRSFGHDYPSSLCLVQSSCIPRPLLSQTSSTGFVMLRFQLDVMLLDAKTNNRLGQRNSRRRPRSPRRGPNISKVRLLRFAVRKVSRASLVLMLVDVKYPTARLNTTSGPCFRQQSKTKKPARKVTCTKQGSLAPTMILSVAMAGAKRLAKRQKMPHQHRKN